jgi:hypothetical protein
VKLQPRETACFHHVRLTGRQFGPVHVILGRPADDPEQWQVVSNEPTSVDTFGEYGERFQIEEGFLEEGFLEEGFLGEKSGLFELEASKLRDANSLERLVMVISVATLPLVSEALDVVERGGGNGVASPQQYGPSDVTVVVRSAGRGGAWGSTRRRSPLAARTELPENRA